MLHEALQRYNYTCRIKLEMHFNNNRKAKMFHHHRTKWQYHMLGVAKMQNGKQNGKQNGTGKKNQSS